MVKPEVVFSVIIATITSAYGRVIRALDLDRLDVCLVVGIALVAYGVAQLYSRPYAYITVGAGLLLFAFLGIVWRLMSSRQERGNR